MDSADAAPPPKAAPLPSEATTATTADTTTNTSPSSTFPEPTVVSPQDSTATIVPVSPTTEKTTAAKRSLACTSASSTTSNPDPNQENTKLVVPALKSKTNTLKQGPIKAKKLKKKKKKFSSILSGMMKPKKEFDVQKERESLRKTLGGGTFCKIDKI